MDSVVLRDMQNDDISSVMTIERACFSTPWSEEAMQSELNNPLAHYRVLIIGDKILAYAGMWLILGEAHITNIAVHPDYRRLGYGEVIVRDAMFRAVELGAESMTLEVRVSNSPAIGLYEKLGFKGVGTRKGFYEGKEDALIMWNRNIIRVC